MSDRVCPYCGMQLGPRAIDLRSAQILSFLPQARLTSFVILFINVALFLVELIVNYRLFHASPQNLTSEAVYLLGAKSAPAIFAGQYWR